MLLHFPIGSGGSGPALRKEEWLALEEWAKAGKARAIGVSHYCKSHLDDVLSVSTLPIALNQNQYHVGMGGDSQQELHDKAYSESKGVVWMVSVYPQLVARSVQRANSSLIPTHTHIHTTGL